MKTVKYIVLLMVVSMLLINSSPAEAADAAAMRSFADTVVNELTTAMETNNYSLYAKHWSPTARKQLSKEKFQQLYAASQVFGKLKSKTFYNTFDKMGYSVYQWKAVFEKAPAPLYLRVVLKETGGRIYVEGHFILNDPK